MPPPLRAHPDTAAVPPAESGADYPDLRLDSLLGTLKPAVNAVRSARPRSHLPMPHDELMWPSRPTPILGMPQSAASCSAICGAQYGSLSLDTIRPGSSSGWGTTAVKLDAAARKKSPCWSGGATKNTPRAADSRLATQLAAAQHPPL